ncbi:Exostosin-3 [Armadillidium nasatum]|uniref:Exostosin-3 n=1 Tax=Armadillidium nasatum TaxID=96803 RepID=A0A5N5TLS1_9CRUS|nr:Exostosin-3 [Armadillidium nasatum]
MKLDRGYNRFVYGNIGGLNARYQWLRPSYLIISILILLIVGPISFHYFLSKATGDAKHVDRKLLIDVEDTLTSLTGISCNSLKSRIEELLAIKASVTTELRDLEQKRQRLQESISTASNLVESLHQEESRLNIELQRLKTSVQQASLIQKELDEKNTPEISAPKIIRATHENNVIMPQPLIGQVVECRMFNCFDYSRCSILSGFPVYFYDVDKYRVAPNDLEVFVKTTVRQAMGYNPHITNNPEEACVFIALVGETVGNTFDKQLLESNLHSLPYWNGDGRNHILLNLARNFYSKDIFDTVNTGRALIVQAHFFMFQYRSKFDILAPPLLGLPGGDLWHNLPPMVPAKRKFLLSFQGELPLLQTYMGGGDQPRDPGLSEELSVVQELSKLSYTTTNDKFYLQFSCRGGGGYGDLREWQICGMETQRNSILQVSTFCLILAPPELSRSSTTALQTRIFEGFKNGAIPVILGNNIEMPFSETIDWHKSSIVLPKARVMELHYFLRTISNADILVMRRQGRMIWEKYLGSTQAILDTILATVRERLNIPPLAAPMEPSPNVFNDSFVPLKSDTIIPEPDTDENLGPVEPPFPSITFKRNFSIALVARYEMWNVIGDPFYLYPYLPIDPILPSEAKFVGSQVGFRPINMGAGGSGKEFSEALGGNSPREQFTIVMLTYERDQVLINSLARLYGLPYLNKVIVVWNSPKPPSETLKWPDLKVPIQVIRAERNSLNNRFLPFSEIETEAVLSVDDDAHLRHDEIVFGFRVWREERDRLVGFPGAAFFHKYYSYVYSQVMPQAIRDKVDEYMNCEDIAMNFLVSHITRRPPVKVRYHYYYYFFFIFYSFYLPIPFCPNIEKMRNQRKNGVKGLGK